MQHTQTLFRGLLMTVLSILMMAPAGAESFRIPTPRPGTFEQVEEAIAQTREFLEDNAMCGGVMMDRTLGGDPGDGSVIAKVEGVPGRDGKPRDENGDLIPSGMSERGEFRFPDEAKGFMTACLPGVGSVTVPVWKDPDDDTQRGAFEPADFPVDENLLTKDPPCFSPDGCRELCERLNELTYEDCRRFDDLWTGDIEVFDAESGETVESRPFTTTLLHGTAPEGNLEAKLELGENERLANVRPNGQRCAQDGRERKFLCSEDWVEADQNVPEEDRRAPVLNCMTCQGEQCRCSLPGTDLAAPADTCPVARGTAGTPDQTEELRDAPVPEPRREDKTFFSFYREYEAESSRDRVGNPDDDSSDALHHVTLPAACYGFYEEFDPLIRKTDPARDDRCVIALPETVERLRETQSVIGRTGPQESDIEDPAPEAPPFDEETDFWRQVPGGMSFPDEKVLNEHDGELTSLFLHPADTRQTAIWQKTRAEPVATGGTQLATDDTVRSGSKRRPFTEWVEALQKGMNDLLTPASVRLRIPADWVAADTSNLDASEDGSTEDESTRTLSVNVQVSAGNDLPAEVLELVEKYFTLQEEKIRVMIPLISRTELSAVIAQWEDWIRLRDAAGKPTGTAADVVAKLKEYRAQIGGYRALRTELGKTALTLLGRQADDTAALTDWMAENAARYREFLERRNAQLSLTPLVREVQQTLAEFSDRANRPWCRSDLLRTPIYTLNDDWNISRPELFGEIACGSGDGKWPALCIPTQRDFVLDLTQFSGRTEPLRIPVLDPRQIHVNLPHPPLSEEDVENIPVLADLDPVPTLDAGFEGQLTVRVTSVPKTIEVPPGSDEDGGTPIDLAEAENALRAAGTILAKRNETYRKFWDSLRPGGEIDDGNRNDRLACPERGAGTCMHTEMDLRERVGSIVSIPVPVGEYLTLTAEPQEILRSPPLRDAVHPPSTGWQVVFPAERGSAVAFPEAQNTFRRRVINDDGTRATDVEFTTSDIDQLFELPPDISLIQKP